MRVKVHAQRGRIGILPWHSLPLDRILEALATQEDGLSLDEAQRRLAEEGPNQLAAKQGVSRWSTFLRQFKSPLIYILLASAGISFFVGKRFDVWVILGIVLINALLGFAQEVRAAGAIAALQKLTSPKARVLRGHEIREIHAAEVVLGDILVLEAGDRVAADARLIRTSEFAVDESGLTGESAPASKTPAAIPGKRVPLGDRQNMAYMNTVVTSGRGRAVVVATGMATEMGQIAQEVAASATETPLQRRLAQFSNRLGLLIMGLIAAVLMVGLAWGHAFAEMFYVSVSLAVSAIPEGLPIVISVLFAIGLTRMARRHALIRRLPAVESLGSATVICSDKTGTLTCNQMTVRQVMSGTMGLTVEGEGYRPAGRVMRGDQRVDGKLLEGLAWLGACARLCNDAILEEQEGEWQVIGDPTEGALTVLAEKLETRVDWERVQEIPFSSERRWMATLHRSPDGELIAFAKGAVDRLLPMAPTWLDEGGLLHPVDAAFRARVAASTEAHAGEALRFLALGMVRQVPHEGSFCLDFLESRLVFLGLVGMNDPIRPEAHAAVRTCQEAGIRVIMITGDHRATGAAIARRLGILRSNEARRIIEGHVLDVISDRELCERVLEVDLYARVSPAHKLRIVKALQQRGEIVAMTGDGVNDAPALAQADIGISMGMTGTEVAKEASSMILADDNFATIVAAVEEGRTLSNNLLKVIHYLLTTSASEILVITGALLLAMPLPLMAVQILWINLVTDGLFDKTLALEKAEPGLMSLAPSPPSAPLVSRQALLRILGHGSITAVGTLGAYAWALAQGMPNVHARTVAFSTLVAFQWFSAFSYRSATKSVLQLPLNPWMLGALALGLVLQFAAVYAPPLQLVLGTTPLSPREFAASILAGSLLLLMSEGIKLMRRR